MIARRITHHTIQPDPVTGKYSYSYSYIFPVTKRSLDLPGMRHRATFLGCFRLRFQLWAEELPLFQQLEGGAVPLNPYFRTRR
jgi:hypothetical protein